MNFKLSILALLGLISWAVECRGNKGRAYVDKINNKRKNKEIDWTAADSPAIDYDDDNDLKGRLGVNADQTKALHDKLYDDYKKNKKFYKPEKTNRLLQTPVNVDLRLMFPSCSSLKKIRDQSACGSCWAVSAATSFSDRFCINAAKRGVFAERSFSYQDLLDRCTSSYGGFGCSGGYTQTAFECGKKLGIATGDGYGEYQHCKPYFLSSYPYKKDPITINSCSAKSTYKIPFAIDRMVKLTDYRLLLLFNVLYRSLLVFVCFI